MNRRTLPFPSEYAKLKKPTVNWRFFTSTNGGSSWLVIKCSRCQTPRDIDPCALHYVPTTFFHDLALRLVCRSASESKRPPARRCYSLHRVRNIRARPMTNPEPSEEELRRLLERGRVFVSWRLLRSIGNSRAAKLTVLIPLIGYLILLNDTVVAHLGLFGEAADATLMRLLAIYCGLVFVAVASVIFAICCPREVKRYASPEEYVAGDEPFMSERQIAIMQKRLTIGDAIAREDNAGYNDYNESRPSVELVEFRRRARRLERVQMNLYYEMLDRSCAGGRWAAAIC
jgi:hypothetical protein